jgi:hypothetical protein
MKVLNLKAKRQSTREMFGAPATACHKSYLISIYLPICSSLYRHLIASIGFQRKKKYFILLQLVFLRAPSTRILKTPATVRTERSNIVCHPTRYHIGLRTGPDVRFLVNWTQTSEGFVGVRIAATYVDQREKVVGHSCRSVPLESGRDFMAWIPVKAT